MDKEILAPEGTAFFKIGDKVALVDSDMVRELSCYTWEIDQAGYAVGTFVFPSGMEKRVKMHVLVNQTPKGKHTDHINRVRLDNRRENLRTCTHAQNMRNKPGRGAVKYKGVSINRWPNTNKIRYMASIRLGGKMRLLGYFDTPEQAARVYDNAARTAHGEFAFLNFP